MNGAQILVKCLEQQGVSSIFGYPGAAIAPFYDALRSSNIRHILVRDEKNAGHAASGYSRASGEVGVCCTTSGPGAVNLLTALATAYMDSVPLLAITGQVRTDLIGRDVFQEADITGACEPFIKYSYLCKEVQDLPRIVREAFHIASTGRPGPVLIDLPVDVQTSEYDGEFEYPQKVNIVGYKPRVQGHALQIKRAVDALSQSQRPVLVAGGGVVSAQARIELIKLAERIDVPVVSTLMGVGIMPTEHRLYRGMLGTHGSECANESIAQADLVVLCGARVGDRSVAAPNQIAERAKIIHIDIDPAEIGKNLHADIPIVGDIRSVLLALCQQCEELKHEEWNGRLDALRRVFQAMPQSGEIMPDVFLRRLSECVSARCKAVLVADVGRNQIWAANSFRFVGGRFLTTGGMGTMGYSLPAAIGAKLAKPERSVIAVCGDGSFMMMMAELSTAVQHDIPVGLIIFNNSSLGMIREIQDKNYDSNYFGCDMPNVDYIAVAKALGADGCSIDDCSQIDDAIDAMLSSERAFVLEVRVSKDISSLEGGAR